MRFGLNLRLSLIVLPLVAAMLVLALAPIRSYLRLRAAMDDVRRELAFVLDVCRFDHHAVRQSVEYFGVAFRGGNAHELEELAEGGRATLESLAVSGLPSDRARHVDQIERAYGRLEGAGETALEMARRGEHEAATRLVTRTLEEHRDRELLPLVDRAQIEGNLALRKALDSLLATSAQLALVPPLAGLEADAKSLRREVSGAISVCRFSRQTHRLLSEYRGFAYFGESPEDLVAAERELDHAYWVWQAQITGDGGGGRRVSLASTGLEGVEGQYRLVKEAMRSLVGLDPASAQREAVRIYESELEPLEGESLPRVLAVAFGAHDERVATLLDSIARQSRLGGAIVGAVALLAFALALVCPWLISRWIVRPVLALTGATRELAAGSGGGPVSVRAGGEIAELAASFDRMSERLAERTRELEEERARERLRHAERLASVGILAAGLAHQINNPVNNILLTAECALGEQDPDAPERWREALVASAAEAKRCERIVRGLVAFSRGDPGQKWREDAHQVVRRAWELTADAAARREVAVELRLGGEPAPILANPIALEQALVNVLRNAVESGPRTRVAVRTETVGSTVRIEIRDDGRGMDRTEVGRLFDPFYTTRADEGGIGLGLSVAHRIVSDHGGEIRVASRPGEGTVVTVDLPLHRADH